MGFCVSPIFHERIPVFFMENLYITKPPPDVGWEIRGGRLEGGEKEPHTGERKKKGGM